MEIQKREKNVVIQEPKESLARKKERKRCKFFISVQCKKAI
jgi:hypothetical protein